MRVMAEGRGLGDRGVVPIGMFEGVEKGKEWYRAAAPGCRNPAMPRMTAPLSYTMPIYSVL